VANIGQPQKVHEIEPLVEPIPDPETLPSIEIPEEEPEHVENWR
jgi:hypothetical protein